MTICNKITEFILAFLWTKAKLRTFYKKKKERERAGQYPVIRPKKLVVNNGFIARPELEFFFL